MLRSNGRQEGTFHHPERLRPRSVQRRRRAARVETSGESIESRENELEVDNANPDDNTAASCYSEGNKKHSLFAEDNGESEDIVDVDGGMCLI